MFPWRSAVGAAERAGSCAPSSPFSSDSTAPLWVPKSRLRSYVHSLSLGGRIAVSQRRFSAWGGGSDLADNLSLETLRWVVSHGNPSGFVKILLCPQGWEVYDSGCELIAKCTTESCFSLCRTHLFHFVCFSAFVAATFWSRAQSLHKARKRTYLICFPFDVMPLWHGFLLKLQW